MGLGTNFCRNMAKRSFQYMVRSTYPIFEKDSNRKESGYNFSEEPSKRGSKGKEPAKDKNGHIVRPNCWCEFQGSDYFIVDVVGKMVVFKDGSKHRASSVAIKGKEPS